MKSRRHFTKVQSPTTFLKKHGQINWQKHTGYGERALVEVAFYRYKKILGQLMHTINFDNQRTEAALACKVLNILTSLGMPKTEMVA